MKSQLNDTRLKCELLEQSLRVLAQENHDMEAKKLHQEKHKTSASANTSHQNNIDLPSSGARDVSTEEEIIGHNADMNDDSDGESEEFFDIGKIFRVYVYLA